MIPKGQSATTPLLQTPIASGVDSETLIFTIIGGKYNFSIQANNVTIRYAICRQYRALVNSHAHSFVRQGWRQGGNRALPTRNYSYDVSDNINRTTNNLTRTPDLITPVPSSGPRLCNSEKDLFLDKLLLITINVEQFLNIYNPTIYRVLLCKNT